jgi:transcriptional regulator with XRE-family HTH domain
MNQIKKRTSTRVEYQILKMKQHIRINKITHQEISDNSGVARANIWRFFSGKSKEPSILTFIAIAESIGYEVSIKKSIEL